ncbi:MAG: response regulator [Treponema sp.]|nr:response regulator [Treponema sp.]
MKKVLIIDTHPLFKDFLRKKLSDDQIEVILTQENRDSFPKMMSILPNLIILDMTENNIEEMDFLEKKAQDPNTVSIPVIITGPTAERSNIAALAKFGVIKYFEKPIKFDILFESIGKVLHHPLSLDRTPSILDLHRNGNIIFIEIALGLNRDKISLLQYKLSEMIEQEEIESPKIVIMLTSLELSFIDGYNLEFLIDSIIEAPKIHTKNIKILSLSPFVQEMIDGHDNYSGISISDNLQNVLTSLVDTTNTSNASEIIADKFLTVTAQDRNDNTSIDTTFFSDKNKNELEELKVGSVVKIAILDGDPNALLQTQEAFEAAGVVCEIFRKGSDFLRNYEPGTYDLLVLDVANPESSGFDVLRQLKNQYNSPPALVYSQNMQRDFIVRVLGAGAKGFLAKPQKSRILVQKAFSLIKGSI